MANLKPLLAEGLDELRQAEGREQSLDRQQVTLAKTLKSKTELPKLRQQYDNVFRSFLRGLQIVNYVRHNTPDQSVSKYCSDTIHNMIAGAQRARDKQTNILMPTDYLVGQGPKSIVTKDGFVQDGPPIFVHNHQTEQPVKSGQPIKFQAQLPAGAYQLTVANFDDYIVNVPEITAQLDTTTPVRRQIPGSSGWCRFLGVTDPQGAFTRLTVASDGSRSSKVYAEIIRIRPVGGGAETNTGGQSWIDAMPTIPDQSMAQGGPQFNAYSGGGGGGGGASPTERLQRLRLASNAWYDEAPPRYSDQQFVSGESPQLSELMRAVASLTEPRPVS